MDILFTDVQRTMSCVQETDQHYVLRTYTLVLLSSNNSCSRSLVKVFVGTERGSHTVTRSQDCSRIAMLHVTRSQDCSKTAMLHVTRSQDCNATRHQVTRLQCNTLACPEAVGTTFPWNSALKAFNRGKGEGFVDILKDCM